MGCHRRTTSVFSFSLPQLTILQQVSAYYLIRWLISYRDPEREKKEAVKKKSDAILRRLNANGTTSGGSGKIEKLVLNSYEQSILTEVVAPEDIHVSFDGELSSVYIPRLR
jgi:hypothetical protein